VFTTPNRPVLSATPGVYDRPGADAVEDATWSARRDTATGYGIAVFDVNPGTEAGGQTSITVTHYHALGADPVNPSSGEPGAPTGDYTVFETFTLVRPRSDGRRWHAKQSASAISGLADLPTALPARGHVRAKRRVHSGTKTARSSAVQASVAGTGCSSCHVPFAGACGLPNRSLIAAASALTGFRSAMARSQGGIPEVGT
jgi:hypothetical protein